MRLASIRGPLLLFVWQTAPVSVQSDSAGKLQLSLGWGVGQFEKRSLSCSGEVLSAEAVPFNAGGAQLDYWPSSNTRLSVYGGGLRQFGTTSSWGGIQAAIEGRRVGFGLGIARMPFEDVYGAAPSAYLRIGSRDHVHFRMDAFHPTTAVGTTGDVFRMGVGFNRGLRRGRRGFVGFGVGPYADESHLGGLFGEFETPVASRIDLSVGGSWRPSAAVFDGGVRAGLRYHLGNRRRFPTP
jgi:hypothetical protein